MTDLESLVTEWRDAREAILLVEWKNSAVAVAHSHLWTRLGNAEAALMAHARGMRPASEPDSFMMIDFAGEIQLSNPIAARALDPEASLQEAQHREATTPKGESL